MDRRPPQGSRVAERALLNLEEPEDLVARVWSELEAQRHTGQARMAGLLASRGVLSEGLGVERASDLIWTLCSLAVHDLLVIERGWTPEEYESWLVGALSHELLG